MQGEPGETETGLHLPEGCGFPCQAAGLRPDLLTEAGFSIVPSPPSVFRYLSPSPGWAVGVTHHKARSLCVPTLPQCQGGVTVSAPFSLPLPHVVDLSGPTRT